MNPLFLLLFLPLLLGKKSSDGSSTSASYVNTLTFVQKFRDVPFSIGDRSAIWPIYKTTNIQWDVVSYKMTNGDIVGNGSRRFGTIRSGGDRYHVGIDLYCNYNDICLATENGIVVGTQGFLNLTKALLLQTTAGPMILYGEVKADSWEEFGISKGSIVKKGQALCRIGINQAGTSMLHFETYKKGTTENIRWYAGKTAPPEILDPTKYLLNCLHNSKNRKIFV